MNDVLNLFSGTAQVVGLCFVVLGVFVLGAKYISKLEFAYGFMKTKKQRTWFPILFMAIAMTFGFIGLWFKQKYEYVFILSFVFLGLTLMWFVFLMPYFDSIAESKQNQLQ